MGAVASFIPWIFIIHLSNRSSGSYYQKRVYHLLIRDTYTAFIIGSHVSWVIISLYISYKGRVFCARIAASSFILVNPYPGINQSSFIPGRVRSHIFIHLESRLHTSARIAAAVATYQFDAGNKKARPFRSAPFITRIYSLYVRPATPHAQAIGA